MKLLTKTLCACLSAVANVSALSTNAMAGESGAAGSAAFQTDGSSSVIGIGVAVSAAVGKQDAFAGAFNDSVNGNNTAFAQGLAGTIAVMGLGSMSITSSNDPDLTTSQQNSFTATTTVFIGTVSGAPVVRIL